VVDPWGEAVNLYETEDAAKLDIERCQKEEAMWEAAKLLVDIAVEEHMRRFKVDRETSLHWINSAMGGT
jgi:hypothetical protein